LNYLYQELGFYLNIRDSKNYSALQFAIERNSTQAFNYLLVNGAHFTSFEENAIMQNETFKAYFNSPQCFLIIVESGNFNAFRFIERHIKTESQQLEHLYTYAVNSQGRNALMLAAANNYSHMFPTLLTLSFDFHCVDHYGKKVFYYLHINNQLDWLLKIYHKVDNLTPDAIEIFKVNIPRFKKDTIDTRNALGNAITYNPTGMSKSRQLPIRFPIEQLHHYRSFSEERERQLLRQVATQLYFGFENYITINKNSLKEAGIITNKNKNPFKEVQIMHLEFAGKHHLYIAANEYKLTPYFLRMLDSYT